MDTLSLVKMESESTRVRIRGRGKVDTIPGATASWIAAMCRGKKTVKVGHMMFATDEGIRNLCLPYFLSLIKSNEDVQAYIRAGGPEEEPARFRRLTEMVAQEIAEYVIKTMPTAYYPGD